MKKNWHYHCTQVVQSLANGPRGSVLEPVLLNLFINDLNDGIECNLRRLASNTKIRAVNVLEGGVSVQRGVSSLENLADGNPRKERQMHSPACKREQLHTAGRTGDNSLESSFLEESSGVLGRGHQCALPCAKES